jgi:leucyl/phenylalanyl-tRNA--protein transferase
MELIPPIMLLDAYARGLFPMALEDGEIGWFSPEQRGILPLEKRSWPHGVRRDLRRADWEIRVDTSFAVVVEACAAREETWIDGIIFRSYLALHELGRAHSVEVWLDGKLAGGLYGVHLGAAFFGESMFHRVSGASKVALVVLLETLRGAGFQLLDTQWVTPHLRQFGAREILRLEYRDRLRRALQKELPFPAFPKKPGHPV